MNTAVATTNNVTPSTQNPKEPQQQQRQTAKEMIAANVKELIARLEAGRSDALTAYLDAMSRFHNYSFGNVLEIARQRPTATRVAGMYAWNQLGRRVKKGEKGIRILAPIIGIKRKKDEEAEKDITKQNTAVLVGLPVRNLRFWIETNVLLFLKDAPFDKRNAELVAAAGSCVDCPSRTGHNKLLFADLGKQDACTNPSCYQAKVDAHIAATVAAKPKLVQISTFHGQQREGSAILPRNQYVAIREDKPADKEQAKWPQFKTCKYTAEAIVAEGEGQGTIQKVCANPECPVHYPKPQKHSQTAGDNAKWKAEQDKQRRDEAIANTTGIRVLAAIGDAVPVRLMKRDLLFVVERLAAMLDENRLAIVAKQHGIKKAKDSDSITKLFAAFLRRAEESGLGRLAVELTIVFAASRGNAPAVLKEAAAVYKVDTDAIAAKVRQEFAAKEKAKSAKKTPAKAAPATLKKTA